MNFLFHKIVLTSFVLLMATPVFSASLTIDSNITQLQTGDQFLASIYLDTDAESVNAIAGDIFYDESIMKLLEIREGNSIVSFWVEKPFQRNPSLINFSGIIPGGFIGEKGLLLQIVFQVLKAGTATMEFQNVQVLKNDGLATPLAPALNNFSFDISPTADASPILVESVTDTTPPEKFTPSISSHGNLFDGKWFLVFSTPDKNSGIDYYEVCEGKKSCQQTDSPYLLRDQKLRSKIIVRAVDKAGNEQVSVVEPTNKKLWYRNYIFLGIIFVMVGVIILRKNRHE